MKNRFKIRLVQTILAGLMTLNSLWLPGAVNAQSVDGTDQPKQVYLPLITGGGQPNQGAEEAATIPGQYIVVFKEEAVSAAGTTATASELAANLGGELLQTYDSALQGFAVKLPTETIPNALAMLQSDPRVSYVEPDRLVRLDPQETTQATTSSEDDSLMQAAGVDAIEAVQTNPPWGLDRIDQRTLPLNQRYNYPANGSGVWAYVIDSGIRLSHSEFQGRAVDGFDAIDGTLPAADCLGHGTHVAGTLGGQTYGVAKSVRLIAVRVFDCNGNGTTSGAIAGVNWVTTQRNNNRTIPMVANMSLSSVASAAFDTAVQASINAGVTYVVSAGNDNQNACNLSPARLPAAITVGATGSADARASFSNFGSCVDLFGPGVGVLSANYTSDSASISKDGTSMATPHVAGVAALYLQSNPAATPAQVTNAILNNATINAVTNPGTGSPNRLLYNPPAESTKQSGFQIIAVHSNNCLDVNGGLSGTANGANVQQWACLGASQANQLWRLVPVGNAFQLVAAHSGKCLDVTGGTTATANGANVEQWACLGASQTNQLWRLVPVGNVFQIVAVHSGKCLDVAGGTSATSNGANVEQWTCLGATQTNQLWQVVPVGLFQLVAQHSGKCLDVTGGTGAINNGANVEQWSCLGANQNNQLWRFVKVSNNRFQVIASQSEKCLDVNGGIPSTADGANVQQWSCLGSAQTNQIWRLVPNGGRFQLIASHSGKCLDVSGGTGATADGTNVQQWSCLGSSQSNQLWEIRKP